MARFAAQLKDKFLGVVDRITGWGSVGRDTVMPEEEEPTGKFPIVQPIEVRSRGVEAPDVGKGDEAGAN